MTNEKTEGRRRREEKGRKVVEFLGSLGPKVMSDLVRFNFLEKTFVVSVLYHF